MRTKRAYVTDEGYLYLSCIVEVIRVWAKLWVYRKEWIATNNSHRHTRNKEHTKTGVEVWCCMNYIGGTLEKISKNILGKL